MSKIGNGTAIVGSAPMAVMHNDVEYNYRQESDFYYLTGDRWLMAVPQGYEYLPIESRTQDLLVLTPITEN